jgi:hypothetical protein
VNRFDDTEEYLRGLRDLDAQEAQEAFDRDRLERLADYGPPVRGWPLRALDGPSGTHTPPPSRGSVERSVNAPSGHPVRCQGHADRGSSPIAAPAGSDRGSAGPPYGDAA